MGSENLKPKNFEKKFVQCKSSILYGIKTLWKNYYKSKKI